MQEQAFQLFADYNQFYLWDEGIGPNAPTEWNDEDVARRLKAAPFVVVICPIRNGKVPVTVQIHDAEPGYDPSMWDHIAEGSLELRTGRLQIHECTGGSIGRFTVLPGIYRVRAFYGSLDSISQDGFEGDDHYLIVLWPGAASEVKVIKQFSERESV